MSDLSTRTDHVHERIRVTPDRCLALCFTVTVLSVIGIPLSDVLPVAIETRVQTTLLLVFALLACGWCAWSVFLIGRGMLSGRLRFTLLTVVLVVVLLALTVAIGAAYGLEAAMLFVLVLAQVAAPAFFVLQSPREFSYRGAGLRGAAIGFISFFSYGGFYGFAFGIEGGYLVGDLGPGFKGWANCEAWLFFLVLTIWPAAMIF